jgi:hypothetical protein
MGSSTSRAARESTAPLHHAIINNDVHEIRTLLDSGADPNVRDKDNNTPLIVAIMNPEVIDLLLAAGADPNIPSEDGCTPLHCTANPDTISLLLAAGADPNVRNKDHKTALYYQRDLRCILLMIRAGADPYSKKKSCCVTLDMFWKSVIEFREQIMDARLLYLHSRTLRSLCLARLKSTPLQGPLGMLPSHIQDDIREKASDGTTDRSTKRVVRGALEGLGRSSPAMPIKTGT